MGAFIANRNILLLGFLLICTGAQMKHSDLTVVDQPVDSNEHSTLNEVIVESEEEREFDVFYPTKEWQSVQPGQAIPKGLHVRLNMETGQREAKLLDSDDKSDLKYWDKDGRQGMLNTKSKSFTRDELKEALKKFKTETITDEEAQAHAEKVKKKFRSYASLKEDLRRMDMDIKTDGEIVGELLSGLKNGSKTPLERAYIFQDLEYYLHQIDNAVLFGDLGGMSLVLSSLNSSHSELRREAAAALASATQSNPKAQIRAMDQGLLQLLLRLMSIDESNDRRKTYLFALSSLIRHFPYAQKEFLKLGGLSTLAALFNDDPLSEALCVKAVTLLHDLYAERETALSLPDEPHFIQKKKQYHGLPLVTSMVRGGWCRLIPTLLSPSRHDTNEKILAAMTDLGRHCAPHFATSRSTLEILRSEYASLSEEERRHDPSDQYFSSIHRSCQSLLSELDEARDEL